MLLLILVLISAATTSPSTLALGSFWGTALYRFGRLLNHPEGLTFDVPTSELRSEYDFIVVGAGTAGATVASRLSEIPGWNVLLIEAGGDELPITDVPMFAPVLSRTHYNWGYKAVPQNNACLAFINRTCDCQKGKTMGGSSTTNYLMYVRGHPADYDYWESLGNPGWGWKHALYYFKKSENMHDPELKNSEFHSTEGYLDVQTVPYVSTISRAFLDTAVEFGYPLVDYNSDQNIGFSRAQATMRNGKRCSSSKAFLRPVRHRHNLHIIKYSQVTKLLVQPENKRVYGVEFQRSGRRWSVKARKEVILSAGSINSPQLMMLSGIGPRDHLQSLGIPVVRDLPGVGSNMQDHISCMLNFLVNDTVTIIGQQLSLDINAYFDYLKRGKGPFTLAGGAEALGFIRTPIATTPLNYPDVEIVMSPTHVGTGSGLSDTARRVFGMARETFNTVFAPGSDKNVFTMSAILLQPESRGWVRLKDKNPFTWPLIFTNYYADPHDLETMAQGMKFIAEFSRSKSFARYNTRINDIPLPGCRHIQFGSDDYWRCVAQQLTLSIAHHCCTAKMGPSSDPMAVVDPELRVYGVKGLRVVDASVMPRIIAGHTNAPVFMIAEKAADLIKASYGKGPPIF